MSSLELNGFLEEALSDPASIWELTALVKSAARNPPDAILYRNAPMLRADAYAIWLRWFIEGVCNPLRYVDDETKTIVHVLADVTSRIYLMYPGDPQDERDAFAEAVADRIMREVERRRNLKRTNASLAQKQIMIDAASGDPRCWVCGFRFSSDAVARFLKKRKGVQLPLPELVDILRPRGLEERDISIEVEHIIPVANGGGGSENLALSCGWCNKSKSALTSIYDVGGRAPRSEYRLGSQRWFELPHPFWTVRVLGTRKRCEHHGYCTARTSNAELFIAPGDALGAPNPTNLHVYCRDHDPYRAERLFSRSDAAQIWAARRKAA